mmetsp:Transcript_88410/g.245445  ORF Transcript_88410/g.245445 Transcript_88410/m.245445 type:complete len:208 (-) Transcript_88410:1-624(-)
MWQLPTARPLPCSRKRTASSRPHAAPGRSAIRLSVRACGQRPRLLLQLPMAVAPLPVVRRPPHWQQLCLQWQLWHRLGRQWSRRQSHHGVQPVLRRRQGAEVHQPPAPRRLRRHRWRHRWRWSRPTQRLAGPRLRPPAAYQRSPGWRTKRANRSQASLCWAAVTTPTGARRASRCSEGGSHSASAWPDCFGVTDADRAAGDGLVIVT